MAVSAATAEVTFLCPDGTLAIRMQENTTRSICKAARTLRATHFVTVDGEDYANNTPLWGVFDMRRAQEHNPTRGEWSIDDPIKRFPSREAAVMYAIMVARKR